MKLLIASDIHGDITAASHVIQQLELGGYDKLLLLGDILYHGPRNALPESYAPKEVIALLSPYKDRILAVRGNCDTEVDQMVLPFPILADYALLYLDGISFFATHGHRFNMQTPPPLSRGDILLHGHTHVRAFIPFGNQNIYVNPGSISLPKEGQEPTIMAYENRTLRTLSANGTVLEEYSLYNTFQ